MVTFCFNQKCHFSVGNWIVNARIVPVKIPLQPLHHYKDDKSLIRNFHIFLLWGWERKLFPKPDPPGKQSLICLHLIGKIQIILTKLIRIDHDRFKLSFHSMSLCQDKIWVKI